MKFSEIRAKNDNFGTSLLLSNSPMAPNIVNGSFAAIYEQSDVLNEFKKTIRLRQEVQNSPARRRRIKGILMSGKQYSLDSILDLYDGIEKASRPKSEVLFEDAENDDNSSGTSGSFDDLSNGELKQFQCQREKRSKSVIDAILPIHITSDSKLVIRKKCAKCGHDIVNGSPKK